MINSWDDLDRAYPMHRDKMTREQEIEFVAHCFDLYEQEGFAKKFWSQGGDVIEHRGKAFAVVGRATEKDVPLYILPMWNIRFEDGEELTAYPDEIIPREMRENGCRLEDIV